MKKKGFDDRLQNDLFPEMPASFERKLKQALENEGVRIRKRPTAAGLFAASISVVAAAAVLLIVLLGVLSGGNSKTNAAAPGETVAPTEAPEGWGSDWKWDTKVIALSTGFEFENTEKFDALCKGILHFLMEQGNREPNELWLCGIKSRYVSTDTGDRTDGYISGYYVLAQHTFGEKNGAPELYCLSEDFEVLWSTKGSAPGPNHAVHPVEDSYAEILQRHFLYGTEPFIAEPGIPHVKRGVLVGTEPGTDVEFSMFASISEVQDRLTAANSAYIGFAREYFLVTVSVNDWDRVMENPILRFETEEGPVDVNMETDLPEAKVVMGTLPHLDPDPASDAEKQGVEYWLSQNQPLIMDLTDDWYGEEIIQKYGRAIARALRTSGGHIASEGIWVCGVFFCAENEAGTPPETAYVLAQYAFDGDRSPELFYYENGGVQWMTKGAELDRINVVYLDGSGFGIRTIAFCKSPAYDNGPLAATHATINVKDYAICELEPVLSLNRIQQRVTGGPNYDAARECFLWLASEDEFGGGKEIRELTVTAQKDGRSRRFNLNQVNVLEPQKVPAMAVESDGVAYPGTVTHLAYALDENGVAAEGTPIVETLRGPAFERITIIRMRDRALPWEISTVSDQVTVDQVDVYSASFERLYANAEIRVVDELPAGEYFLCFHTTTLGPYSEKAGRYTFTTDFTIYKAKLN